MLYWLGVLLAMVWEPLGFPASPFFLAALGPLLAAALTWVLLPRFWERMPRDHGKAFAVDGSKSQGKPTGTGFIFMIIYVFVCLLVVPLSLTYLGMLGCLILAMLSGFLDDGSEKPWHEYKKAALDVGIVVAAALVLCGLKPVEWWFPFIRHLFHVPVWLFVPLAAGLLWFSINATNCTDGVDNLCGSLCSLAFIYLGALLISGVGAVVTAGGMAFPYGVCVDGAAWAIMAFTMVGTLAGYLWYNANPSTILMGDAGSRPLGLLLGALVLASGNPFLILVVAGVILVNGGAGLFKVALKRFFNIEFLWTIRFPLHDHMKTNFKWSAPQVLVRFMLIQAILTPVLLLIVIKVR